MKLRTWPYKVTMGFGAETKTYVVHARHRAEAKQLAAEQIDWTPTIYSCVRWKPSQRSALERVANEVQVAVLSMVVIMLIVVVTAPIWYPASKVYRAIHQ